MARKAFYSFHYVPDNWRAAQVRNMGIVEGNRPATDNDWETIADAGDSAIEKWVDDQMSGRTCTIVLIGSGTAGRKWITYEIKKAWNDGKGVFGIHIHNLKDKDGDQSSKGSNPFGHLTVGKDSKLLSSIVYAYNPPYSTSTYVYDHIHDNVADWIEKAISIRAQY